MNIINNSRRPGKYIDKLSGNLMRYRYNFVYAFNVTHL